MTRIGLLLVCLFFFHQAAHAGEILDHVKSAKVLRCAANRDAADYSKFDTHGQMLAFGADLCKAVATAILGPGARTDFSAYPDEQSAIIDLRAHKIDLFMGASADPDIAKAYMVSFGPSVFDEGQGFLVAKSAHVHSLQDLAGKQVCYISETSFEDNLIKELGKRDIKYMPFPFEEQGEMEAAFVTGHCAAITANISKLANTLTAFRRRSRHFEIMPYLITRDPIAPVFAQGDKDFANVISLSVKLLFATEPGNVSRQELVGLATGHTANPLIVEAYNRAGAQFGLDTHWATNVLGAVGNYGDIYDRDLGTHSPYNLPRRGRALVEQRI